MARPIPEVKMLEPGEQLEINLDAWTSWRRDGLNKATLAAFQRWKKGRETTKNPTEATT